MSDLYIFELHPRNYGFLKSKRRWQKHFPPLSQKNAYVFTFRVKKGDIGKYKTIAKRMRVNCLAYPLAYERSSNYRSIFLKSHPPIRGKYRCWYCGKRTKDITVDHIYPVKLVQTDEKLQRKLKRKGILNVNDEKNLALSCEKCNKKKSLKIGSYPRRAALGRHEGYWTFLLILRLLLVFAAISFGLYLYFLLNK